MKKIIFILSILLMFTAFSGYHRNNYSHGRGKYYHAKPHFSHRLPPPPPRHRYYNNWLIGSGIVVNSIIASTIYNTIKPSPIIVSTPNTVVVQQPSIIVQPKQVWIDGRYVDQLQSDGTIIRIWVPGHWEYR